MCACACTPHGTQPCARLLCDRAKTLNAGQTCIAPDYVLVHEAVAKDFFAELVRALRDQMGPDPRASEVGHVRVCQRCCGSSTLAAQAFGRIINERHCRRLAELLDEPESVRYVHARPAGDVA